MSVGQLVYIGLVLLIGGVVVVRATDWLHRVRRMRIRLLEARDELEFLPGAPTKAAAKDRRLLSEAAIEQQFSVSRRLLIPSTLGAVGLLLALPFLGQVPAASLSVLVAVVTVLVGLMLRPTVENAVAGLVLSSSKLVSLGDTVLVDDVYGTVEDISPTHTTIKVWDWRRLLVPNARMLSKEIINYSLFDRYYWAWVDLWVEPATDLEALEAALLEIPGHSPRVMPGTDVDFWVMELGTHAVRCRLAAWAATPSDGWYLKDDMNRGIQTHLRQAGVLPQRQHLVVHSSSGRGDT